MHATNFRGVCPIQVTRGVDAQIQSGSFPLKDGILQPRERGLPFGTTAGGDKAFTRLRSLRGSYYDCAVHRYCRQNVDRENTNTCPTRGSRVIG